MKVFCISRFGGGPGGGRFPMGGGFRGRGAPGGYDDYGYGGGPRGRRPPFPGAMGGPRGFRPPPPGMNCYFLKCLIVPYYHVKLTLSFIGKRSSVGEFFRL